jgi:hypothetical protein
MPVIVDSKKSRTVVVDRASVAAIVQNRPSGVAIADRRTAQVVEKQSVVVGVASTGLRGQRGEPGLSPAGLLPPINFAFGDAPGVVLVLAMAVEVMLISLQVEEVFNGAGAQVQLGTLSQPGLLMAGNESDLSVLATFENTPRVELPAGTALYITVTPGAGANQGRGQFVVSAVPAS